MLEPFAHHNVSELNTGVRRVDHLNEANHVVTHNQKHLARTFLLESRGIELDVHRALNAGRAQHIARAIRKGKERNPVKRLSRNGWDIYECHLISPGGARPPLID